MEPEDEGTARLNVKSITAKRLAVEAGAVTRVRVEAKTEVRDSDVGIFLGVLNKVKAASNKLKRAMVASKEEIKENVERSEVEVEAY